MKILHLCGGGLNSGATLGASALHQGLHELGVTSKLIFSKGAQSNSVLNAEPFFESSAARKLLKTSTKFAESSIIKFETKQKKHGLSTGLVGHPFFLKNKEVEDADIIHLHWINSRFLRIKAIQHFKKPIVWSLRDAWPYTGGCHYTNQCERYKIGCGECPLIGSTDPHDLTWKIVNIKNKHLPTDIRYIALSNWTASQARQSYLLKNRSVQVIFNSIADIFLSPPAISQEDARRKFNLPQSKTLILAGASSLDSKYKGYSPLLPQLPDGNTNNCHLVTFGRISEQLKCQIRMSATHLGPISSQEQLKSLYHAADIFIAPSVQEAFGKTLAEAGACGLPVVCYDIGGPKDIVLDRQTGYRIQAADINAFINKTLELSSQHEIRKEMSHAAIQHTHRLFSPRKVAEQHIALYRELLNDS